GILETGHGPLNVQYANNFFANASTSQYGYYLLRFYGEWEGLRIGYGYSAMTDENAIPATLDYEGPNSLIITYNAQIRYTRALLDLGDAELVGLASLEAASPSVTNANSTDQRAPDIIVGAALRGDNWHVQATGVLSSFSSQTAVGTSDALGWGLSLSGAWNFTEDDELMAWASGGSGYANYLQDVSGLGLDAYVDASGQLQTIGAWGFGVGYEHSWTDAVSSTFTIGYINIDDENTGGVINPFVMHETYYASGNVVWQIFPELTVGAELLYGRKRAINGSDGDDFRLQITTRYSFNP
ncbi:MAG: DcaP family trimeric outer membrane transporter, partial [Puniceicoccales bacterium]